MYQYQAAIDGLFTPSTWTVIEFAVDIAVTFIFLQLILSMDDSHTAGGRIDPSERGQGEHVDIPAWPARDLPRLAGDEVIGEFREEEDPFDLFQDDLWVALWL